MGFMFDNTAYQTGRAIKNILDVNNKKKKSEYNWSTQWNNFGVLTQAFCFSVWTVKNAGVENLPLNSRDARDGKDVKSCLPNNIFRGLAVYECEK